MYIICYKLLGHVHTVSRVVHKDVEIFLLQLERNLARRLLVGRSAHNCGKTWRCAVNELNAALSEDHVVGSAKPDIVGCRIFRLCVKIRLINVPD